MRSAVFTPAFAAVLPAVFGAEALWICHSAAEAATAAAVCIMLYLSSRKPSR